MGPGPPQNCTTCVSRSVQPERVRGGGGVRVLRRDGGCGECGGTCLVQFFTGVGRVLLFDREIFVGRLRVSNRARTDPKSVLTVELTSLVQGRIYSRLHEARAITEDWWDRPDDCSDVHLTQHRASVLTDAVTM